MNTKQSQKYFLGLMVILFLLICIKILRTAEDSIANNPTGINSGIHKGDSGRYLVIAQELFKKDGWKNMVYRAHRQPLYPFFLSPTALFSADETLDTNLIRTNAVLAILSMLVLVFFLRKPKTYLPGLLLVLYLYIFDFRLVKYWTTDLYTELIYVPIVLLLVHSYSRYLDDRDDNLLWLTFTFSGLAYLTRPNGLFLFITICFLIIIDISLNTPNKAKSIAFAKGIGVFVIITIPSWLPRLLVYGNPIYHSYLPNFLWAESYVEGHTTDRVFSNIDFLANNDLSSSIARIRIGINGAYRALTRESNFLLYCLLASLISPIFNRKYLYIVAFMVIQSVPIMWTIKANPAERLIYFSYLPFLLYFIYQFVGFVCERIKVFLEKERFIYYKQ